MRISKLKTICVGCLAMFIAMFMLVGFAGRRVNKIVITGDAEVMEYIESLAYYYTKYVKQDVSIDVNAPGSSQAVKDVAEGIADYGMVARKLTSAEAGFKGKIVTTDVVLATEAFVLIVNKDFNTELISKMDVATASSLFWKEESSWRAFIKDKNSGSSGDDTKEVREERNKVYGEIKVTPVQRKKGDGLRDSFEDISNIKAQLVGNTEGKTLENYADRFGITKESDGEIVEYIKQNVGSVGYVRYTTYKANEDEVKMLPISNSSGTLIKELSAENFRSSTAEKDYPLKREFNYFYNKDNSNAEARMFFDWVTTGFTESEFKDYLDDGIVKNENGEINAGTVPFAIGSQDSIMPEYKTYRRKKVERLLTPSLEEKIVAFPYKNMLNEMNETLPLEITGDIDLPTEINGAKLTYISGNYEVLNPESQAGKGLVKQSDKSVIIELKVKMTLGSDKKELQVTREWTVTFKVLARI
jgi:ABC-type phosphate transport system substrate-binding protein